MITASKYENGVDENWFDSSTIVYTRFEENPENNLGQLYVTFKGGATYRYANVDMPTNYLQFKHEMKDSSPGKSLNAFIKPFYQCTKVDNMEIEQLMYLKETILKDNEEKAEAKRHTYFISGHRDILPEEFDKYYLSAIDDALENDPEARFVVGDYYGADIMAQDYLVQMGKAARVTVYHMMDTPRNINPEITKTQGGYETDEARDSAMTDASSFDIAFVRPGKLTSGTAQNIARRHLMR